MTIIPQISDSSVTKRSAQDREFAKRSTFCSIAAIITGIVTLILILVVIILGITGVVK